MQDEISAEEYQALLNKPRGPAKVRFNSASGKILEKEVQAQITDWLCLKQIFHWKQNNTGIKKENGSWIPSNLPGVSDVLGILPNGRFLAIEVKRPGGKPSEAQLEFIDNINGNGGLGFVADNLQLVMDTIEAAL